MDYVNAIRSMIESFTWNYKKDECKEFYRYQYTTLNDVLQVCQDFVDTEKISEDQIKELLDFIANNEVMETFINECIAPYVQNFSVGNSPADEFYRSIEIYNQQISHVDSDAMVVVLTPLYTAASLIQNAYLFVNDLVVEKKNLSDYTSEQLDEEDIYFYLIKLIINPFMELLIYHLYDMEVEVPVLVVSSLGTLTAEFMRDNADEFLAKITNNITSQLKEHLPDDIKDLLDSVDLDEVGIEESDLFDDETDEEDLN